MSRRSLVCASAAGAVLSLVGAAVVAGVSMAARASAGPVVPSRAGDVPGSTVRVSMGLAGQEPDGHSGRRGVPSMSVQGRFIVFASAATNLVPGDTNRRRDIFVLDRATGVIERVSVSSGEEQAHRGSFSPAISAHGRYVTFSSSAANLVPNDTGRSHDVFMRDRVAGVTRRISVNSRGIPADTGESGCPCDISTHGRFVSFASNATNFAPRHRGSDRSNVYVRDTVAHVTERISDGLDGGAGNWPSCDVQPGCPAW